MKPSEKRQWKPSISHLAPQAIAIMACRSGVTNGAAEALTEKPDIVRPVVLREAI